MPLMNIRIRFYFLIVCISLITAAVYNRCVAFTVDDARLLTDQNYFPAVKDLLHNATQSIKVIMFEASYYKKNHSSQTNQLIDELIAARKRGLDVEVILEVREAKERASLRNLETARILQKGGVEVTLDAKDITTHAKVVLIDNNIAILGSTNWTYSALNKNHEVSVLMRSKNAVKDLEEYFRKIQKSGQKL